MNQVIADIVNALYGLEVEVELTRPDAKFGDFATNIALQISKRLQQNPRQIAEQVASELGSQTDIIEAEVAGPGFINLRLSDSALIRQVYSRPARSRLGQIIVIETNNPNPFKPMHIGHAYNAVLADSMANLLAISGADTKRVSYHGDVGAHVGKSMWALLDYVQGDAAKLDQIEPQKRNQFMGEMYALGAKKYTSDPTIKAAVDELAKQSFDRQDKLYAQVYQTVFNWSFEQIDATVKRLGNLPTERRYLESQADPIGVEIVKSNSPEVFQESDGALIFAGSEHGSFDNAFVGSNGRGLYAARDLGLIQLKAGDYPDMKRSIVVTGAEQAAYFKGVIAAAELALPQLSGRLVNYPTGLVKLSSGKMSSRTGDVVTIDWLFSAFGEAIKQRGGEATETIVAGALRYQFLKVKVGGDVIFDVNEAVSLSGNTGSYLQYAHARARRIIEKSAAEFAMPAELKSEDRPLVRKLGEYHEIVNLATRSLEPHHICSYLFELSQEFNRYYETNQVIGSEHEAHRLSLVALYADILKAGLAVLGIEAPDSM